MRIALGQFAATADKAENVKAAVTLIDGAAEAGAELVVLPESSLYLDITATSLAEIAEPLDGEFVSTIARQAAGRSIAVVVGTTERGADGGLPHNTVVWLDASGQLAGSYRKVHLFDAFGFAESSYTAAGGYDEPFVIDLGGLRLGVLTCYDVRFPESARRLVDAGANVLVLPACWAAGPGKEYQWSTLVRARAIENTSYVLAANQTGPFASGHSLVVDPMGVVVATGSEVPGLVLAELAVDRVDDVRLRVPSLMNRRFSVVPRRARK